MAAEGSGSSSNVSSVLENCLAVREEAVAAREERVTAREEIEAVRHFVLSQREVVCGQVEAMHRRRVEEFIASCKRRVEEVEASCKRRVQEVEASCKRKVEEVEDSCKRGVDEVEASCKRRVEEVEASRKRRVEEVEALCKRRVEEVEALCKRRVEEVESFCTSQRELLFGQETVFSNRAIILGRREFHIAERERVDGPHWRQVLTHCAPEVEVVSWAAEEGHLSVVKYCLEETSSMDFRQVALNSAAAGGQLDVVKYLVEETTRDGAENWMSFAEGVLMVGESFLSRGVPSVVLASREGQLNVLMYLIQAGNVGVETLNAALIAASEFGQLDIARYLIEECRVSPNVDIRGFTAFHWAASNGHLDMMKYLMECGVSPNVSDIIGIRD